MANEKGAGRLRKPTALKLLEGGKAPAKAKAEPKPSNTAPRRPAGLTRRARVHWDRLAPELIKMGVLTSWDVNLFGAYCEAMARYEEARLLVNKHGLLTDGQKGNLVKNPAVQIQRDSSLEAMRIGARFGLSPSERGAVEIPNPPSKTGIARFT